MKPAQRHKYKPAYFLKLAASKDRYRTRARHLGLRYRKRRSADILGHAPATKPTSRWRPKTEKAFSEPE